ncbi:MAG: methyl-accepting chemotaxis protein [Verrucomicrobia bacterium]|nr:methyl-accepting chemotaxis protein [Verrucomicrobiota bacterium]
MRVPIGRKLFLSHLIAVIFVSGSIGSYFYFSANRSLMQSLQTRLKNSAAIISVSLSARDLSGIDSKDDVSDPTYLSLLDTLRRMRRSNPDIAYLYVMRRVDGGVQFVVDSDETEEQALPGQPYEDVVPALLEGFDIPSVDDDIYSDEWGSFLSGYAPIGGGNGDYLIGIDMRADEVAQKFKYLRLSGLISLVFSVVLALVFGNLVSRRFVKGIHALIVACRNMADGRHMKELDIRTGDEFDSLIEAFNTMSGKLNHSRKELEESNEQLENRVRERTRELQESLDRVKQLSGLLPICANCKSIRDDKGYWRQVEGYLQEHSEAVFTHGICPKCMKALYPDQAD